MRSCSGNEEAKINQVMNVCLRHLIFKEIHSMAENVTTRCFKVHYLFSSCFQCCSFDCNVSSSFVIFLQFEIVFVFIFLSQYQHLSYFLQAPGGPKGQVGDSGAKVRWCNIRQDGREFTDMIGADAQIHLISCSTHTLQGETGRPGMPGEKGDIGDIVSNSLSFVHDYPTRITSPLPYHEPSMEASSGWMIISLPVFQGSIGDPGPVGYSGMKVKTRTAAHHWCYCVILELISKPFPPSLAPCGGLWPKKKKPEENSFIVWLVYLSDDSNVSMSVSRETVVAEERRYYKEYIKKTHIVPVYDSVWLVNMAD